MPVDQDDSLIEAANTGDIATVKRLLGHGANPNCADDRGLTPLSIAAFGGHRELVLALIAAGADVHAKDTFGRTALHHAASSGQTLIAVRLLMNGLDPRDEYDGRSAIDVASMMGHKHLALILYL